MGNQESRSLRRWYAMMDTERVCYLGEFDAQEGFDEADEKAGEIGSAVWIIPQSILTQLIESAKSVMRETQSSGLQADDLTPFYQMHESHCFRRLGQFKSMPDALEANVGDGSVWVFRASGLEAFIESATSAMEKTAPDESIKASVRPTP